MKPNPLKIVTTTHRPVPLPDSLSCIKSRIAAHIAQRDRLVLELSHIDGLLAVEARRYADAEGLMVRPRIEQLRLAVRDKAA